MHLDLVQSPRVDRQRSVAAGVFDSRSELRRSGGWLRTPSSDDSKRPMVDGRHMRANNQRLARAVAQYHLSHYLSPHICRGGRRREVKLGRHRERAGGFSKITAHLWTPLHNAKVLRP
jgi:hypothetical protein